MVVKDSTTQELFDYRNGKPFYWKLFKNNKNCESQKLESVRENLLEVDSKITSITCMRAQHISITAISMDISGNISYFIVTFLFSGPRHSSENCRLHLEGNSPPAVSWTCFHYRIAKRVRSRNEEKREDSQRLSLSHWWAGPHSGAWSSVSSLFLSKWI